MQTFGERLTEIRKRRNLTLTELSRMSGCITPQGISMLERGDNGRTLEKLPRLAKALGCSIDELFPEMDQESDEVDFL